MPPTQQRWLLGLVAITVLLAVAFGGETIRAQNGSSTRNESATQNGSSTRAGSDSRQQRPLHGKIHSGKRSGSVHRLREGTRVTDVLGYFQQNGEGATFVTKENYKFGGLPNLNLQRVLRMLKGVEEPENVKWNVSGTITEFDGRNYLLISRAVYKSNALPPAPDRVSE